MVRLKDCLYLLSLFLVESLFSSVCDCLVPGIALPCVPSLLPHLHQGSVGQHFFHLNHCCFSYSEIPFLLPSWESNKSQKLCLNSVAPKWGKKLCLPGNREQSDRGVWVSVCWSSDSCKRMPLLWRTPGLDGKPITCTVKYLRIFYVSSVVRGTWTSAFESLCINLLKQLFVFLFHVVCGIRKMKNNSLKTKSLLKCIIPVAEVRKLNFQSLCELFSAKVPY